MKGRILPFTPEAEYFFEEGCHIIECSNSADDPAVSIARARVEPGVTTRLHRLHGVTERYVILQGEGLVDVGNLQGRRVRPGDVVTIPSLSAQRIGNVGSVDLIFLAICSPRFTNECYEGMG
jgi:mannose-6-phosphate isomerase-like protein (cupin superfamily)